MGSDDTHFKSGFHDRIQWNLIGNQINVMVIPQTARQKISELLFL